MPRTDFADPLADDAAKAASFSWPERANIVFASIAIAFGLFCAFYFFNGTEVVRNALAWGEYLYPTPSSTGRTVEVANRALPDEGPLPQMPTEKSAPRPDRTGDPFTRARKLISIDRPLRSFARGHGLTAGSLPSVLPPLTSAPSVLPPVENPGVPGGAIGGLPGPGTLISRLTLLVPGADSLTRILQTAATNVVSEMEVTLRDAF
jgi:hypothetical protein